MKNQLSTAHSPYLLQHANNPIHWNFWNENTLERAIKENKLLVISIGYSACHWCHVMEHETFENQEVADLMNANFISIKIDREEHPVVDAVYMKALQLMTKQGGWPLNIVALPNGQPVWGATYVNKDGWKDVLSQLADLYQKDPEKMFEYAQRLLEGIEIMSDTNELPKASETFDIEKLLAKWKKSFDWEFGGYSRAPKFMMPTNLEFLQTYGALKQDKQLLAYVDLTLTRMAWGGLFDTVQGGFSRYSVDHKWHVPHFEKMLYDNALLLKVYSDAYKRTKDPLYLDVINKTIRFIKEELKSPDGAYFAALDADSLDEKNKLTEGAYYVWKATELKQILGSDFDLFSEVFNCNAFGYWEEENYVLIQNEPLSEIAKRKNLSTNELIERKVSWETKLFSIRNNRSKPRLDDKILTSWNAMLLSGLSAANTILESEEVTVMITKLEHFITIKLTNDKNELGHVYKNGASYINGVFEDYAFVIQAYLDLYTNTFDEDYLQKARNYTNVAFDLFFDVSKDFFRSDVESKNLIVNHFEIEDNVIPSANAIMANNLIILGYYSDHSYYKTVSQKMLDKILPSMDYASAFSHWLLAYLKTTDSFQDVSIIGPNAYVFQKELKSHFIPNTLFAGTTKATTLPILKNYPIDKETAIYLCTNNRCLPPIENTAQFLIVNKKNVT